MSVFASLAVGAVIVWKFWGTWWLLGGVALLAFGGISLASSGRARVNVTRAGLGVSARLDPREANGQEGLRQED
ncbi:hypothetical protein ACH4GE_36645 [Streptomyces tendae]|uniref:hypothetical protein n=1 Tax=Streptomyces tendae TaxID=1932 RepID=UPI0037B88B3E